MRAALHLRTTILPGGIIEIAADVLPSDEAAEISVVGCRPPVNAEKPASV